MRVYRGYVWVCRFADLYWFYVYMYNSSTYIMYIRILYVYIGGMCIYIIYVLYIYI